MAARLEIKVADLSPNPYLLMGGVAAAVRDALNKPRSLPAPVAGPTPGGPVVALRQRHAAQGHGGEAAQHRDRIAAGGGPSGGWSLRPSEGKAAGPATGTPAHQDIAAPQACSPSSTGIRSVPFSVREYSTLGGTSGYTSRCTTPACSSSRS